MRASKHCRALHLHTTARSTARTQDMAQWTAHRPREDARPHAPLMLRMTTNPRIRIISRSPLRMTWGPVERGRDGTRFLPAGPEPPSHVQLMSPGATLRQVVHELLYAQTPVHADHDTATAEPCTLRIAAGFCMQRDTPTQNLTTGMQQQVQNKKGKATDSLNQDTLHC